MSINNANNNGRTAPTWLRCLDSGGTTLNFQVMQGLMEEEALWRFLLYQPLTPT